MYDEKIATFYACSLDHDREPITLYHVSGMPLSLSMRFNYHLFNLTVGSKYKLNFVLKDYMGKEIWHYGSLLSISEHLLENYPHSMNGNKFNLTQQLTLPLISIEEPANEFEMDMELLPFEDDKETVLDTAKAYVAIVMDGVEDGL